MTPLFPLGTVLLPGGTLPLRIFEPRYLDMISESLRGGHGFGVNLIRSGAEVGEAAECHEVGTLARIADWHSLAGGLLGITVTGGERYRIRSISVRPNNLLEGELEWLQDVPGPAAGEIGTGRYAWLQPLLEDTANSDRSAAIEANRLSFLLAERLDLPLPRRQELLELNDETQRLDRLHELLQPGKD